MPNYNYLKKKKLIINSMEFFEKCRFFFGKISNFNNLKKKNPIYSYTAMIGNTHLFPLHNEPSSMPVR